MHEIGHEENLEKVNRVALRLAKEVADKMAHSLLVVFVTLKSINQMMMPLSKKLERCLMNKFARQKRKEQNSL